jgi:hypothetical protein
MLKARLPTALNMWVQDSSVYNSIMNKLECPVPAIVYTSSQQACEHKMSIITAAIPTVFTNRQFTKKCAPLPECTWPTRTHFTGYILRDHAN